MQQSTDNTTIHPHGSPVQQQRERLPCRGCTRQCAYYQRCNRAPWRMQIPAAGAESGAAS